MAKQSPFSTTFLAEIKSKLEADKEKLSKELPAFSKKNTHDKAGLGATFPNMATKKTIMPGKLPTTQPTSLLRCLWKKLYETPIKRFLESKQAHMVFANTATNQSMKNVYLPDQLQAPV